MAGDDQTEKFAALRQAALAAADGQAENDQQVLALLMESGTGDAVASLSVMADGSVNFCFSNGGGIIGADEHRQIRDEALSLLQAAGDLLGEMSATDSFPLPDQGFTRFYAATRRGVFTAESPEADLDYERHHLSPLFFQAHRLISFLRMVDELSRAVKASADRGYVDYE